MRKWRKKVGVTQATLVELLAQFGLQYSQPTISKWERGDREVPAVVVDTLTEFYQCTSEDMGLEPSMYRVRAM